jgi:hypothetical protein
MLGTLEPLQNPSALTMIPFPLLGARQGHGKIDILSPWTLKDCLAPTPQSELQ